MSRCGKQQKDSRQVEVTVGVGVRRQTGVGLGKHYIYTYSRIVSSLLCDVPFHFPYSPHH